VHDRRPKPTYDLKTFPYHPLVHELDLATLAYQLHARSMVWPVTGTATPAPTEKPNQVCWPAPVRIGNRKLPDANAWS